MSAISKEDIEFLKELQNELKTQQTDCQASPRYWGVAENKREYGVDPKYCSDGCSIYSSEYDIDYDDDEIDAFKEYLVNNEYCEEEEIAEMNDLEEIRDFLEDEKNIEMDIGYYCNVKSSVTRETGCFLTKRACKRHIELNHYHYKEPHTYAMTAWRNPEFERLLKIITETDWDQIK